MMHVWEVIPAGFTALCREFLIQSETCHVLYRDRIEHVLPVQVLHRNCCVNCLYLICKRTATPCACLTATFWPALPKDCFLKTWRPSYLGDNGSLFNTQLCTVARSVDQTHIRAQAFPCWLSHLHCRLYSAYFHASSACPVLHHVLASLHQAPHLSNSSPSHAMH